MPSLDRVYVLVVDDNADARAVMKLGLEHEGAVVFVAPSAPEAIEMMSTVVPDVIVTDITMPPMDGYELLHELKASPAWRHIPVIAVSGYPETHRGPRVRAAGFADYLLKPVIPARLMAAILRAVGSRPR
jgi:CheY-like chemotaxis protein